MLTKHLRFPAISGLLLLSATFLCAHFSGRMTGGGSIFQGDLRITHGFELHCGEGEAGEFPPAPPNNLEINWGGNKFHMTEIIFGVCTNEGVADPPPGTRFTTYDGAGWGRYNGVDHARVSFRFTDFGEPGVKDEIVRLTIVDAGGNVVLSASPARLTFGNHQAHNR